MTKPAQGEQIIVQCPKCLEVQEYSEVCIRCGLLLKDYRVADQLNSSQTPSIDDNSGSIISRLDFISDEIKDYLDQNRIERCIWSKKNFSEFSERSTYASSLIFKEGEILLFSILQWVAIGLVYYIWVQMLEWIPNEVWESHSEINDKLLNLALLFWSFICVALAAYPISILTGAMGAAHFLRQQGHSSTIASCLKLAFSNSKKLWMFHTADGWITVNMILERLPKQRMPSPEEMAMKEAMYYAWKVGTIGVPAALLTGKGLIEAGKQSISLVKNKLWDVLRLRGGYSMACWIIGITAYLGSIIFFINCHGLFHSGHKIYSFYFWMGVPILIAVGVIELFVRPLFVIASCKLYSDYLKERGESTALSNLPGKGVSAFVVFVVLCGIILTVFLYREKIGLMSILRVSG